MYLNVRMNRKLIYMYMMFKFPILLQKELEYGRIEITSGGFQLIINDAKPDDVAQYSCELSNDAGVDSR